MRNATNKSHAAEVRPEFEKVLELGPAEALREVIANALDEKALTDTKSLEIFKDRTGNWHVCDYGRGRAA